MSKIDFNKKTKITTLPKNTPSEELSIIPSKKNIHKTKSFRFRLADLERIKNIVTKTNNVSESTIFNETDIIRGLLALGNELDGKKIISLIRKSI